MIHQIDIYGRDKVQKAVELLRLFEPKDGSGYFLAFSGGKDSVCVKTLADMAGVKYDAHYNVTSVDPPELVRFIKASYPDVVFDHATDDNGKPITMWSLIRKKKYPPTRLARYCCAALKETNGEGRTVVTGVRWAESINRKNNQGTITIQNKNTEDDPSFERTNRGGVVLKQEIAEIILNNDNDERRNVMDFCIKQRKKMLNPIIDWEDEDVWEFIKEYNIPYCSLYDEGYKRLGCIGCPMGRAKQQLEQFARWPKYKELYQKAMNDCIRADPGRFRKWKTGEDMFNWWIGETDDKEE